MGGPDLFAQLAGKSSKDLVTPRKRKFRPSWDTTEQNGRPIIGFGGR